MDLFCLGESPGSSSRTLLCGADMTDGNDKRYCLAEEREQCFLPRCHYSEEPGKFTSTCRRGSTVSVYDWVTHPPFQHDFPRVASVRAAYGRSDQYS